MPDPQEGDKIQKCKVRKNSLQDVQVILRAHCHETGDEKTRNEEAMGERNAGHQGTMGALVRTQSWEVPAHGAKQVNHGGKGMDKGLGDGALGKTAASASN